MPGIPVTAPVDGAKRPGVIFVLEKACLEVGKVGKNFQILNSDDHANYQRKQNRNPADYRPDIIHQALLAIFDSPLAKAGRLQAVYVKTEKGVFFEIKPYVHIPRTFKRFCGRSYVPIVTKTKYNCCREAGETSKCHKESCDSPFACQFQENSFRIPCE